MSYLQSRFLTLPGMFIVLGMSAFGLNGCGGPLGIFAGGALQGERVAFAPRYIPAEGGVFALEVRPGDPYSVHVNMFVIDGALYIDPAQDRTWYQLLKEDDNVGVRFTSDGPVYEARAYSVSAPEILEQFDPDRIVLRIAPR